MERLTRLYDLGWLLNTTMNKLVSLLTALAKTARERLYNTICHTFETRRVKKQIPKGYMTIHLDAVDEIDHNQTNLGIESLF